MSRRIDVRMSRQNKALNLWKQPRLKSPLSFSVEAAVRLERAFNDIYRGYFHAQQEPKRIKYLSWEII